VLAVVLTTEGRVASGGILVENLLAVVLRVLRAIVDRRALVGFNGEGAHGALSERRLAVRECAPDDAVLDVRRHHDLVERDRARIVWLALERSDARPTRMHVASTRSITRREGEVSAEEVGRSSLVHVRHRHGPGRGNLLWAFALGKTHGSWVA